MTIKKFLSLGALSFLSLLKLNAEEKKLSSEFFDKSFPGVDEKNYVLATEVKEKQSKWLVFEFWAHWCGPCKASMQDLAKHSAIWEKQGVSLFLVNIDGNAEKSKEFQGKEFEGNRVKGIWLLDGESALSSFFGVRTIPHMIVLNKAGTLLTEGHPAEVISKVNEFIAGTNEASVKDEKNENK